MVARGDMGVEIPYIELPPIQKKIIKKCYLAGKKVITATQMLESMISHSRPTRAETSDVANAVFDGTSATMLSGETAAGKYPVETVRAMAAIAEQAESNIRYKHRFEELETDAMSITDAVCHACVAAAHDLDAAAVIAITQSGATARMISKFRPQTPIISATVDEKAYNKMSLSWGVIPVRAQMQSNTDELLRHAMDVAKNSGAVHTGDLVVLVAGIPVGVLGNTNMLKVDTI